MSEFKIANLIKAERERARKRLQYHRKNRKHFTPVIRGIEKAGGLVRVELCSDDLTINISGTKDNLVGAWRVLRKNGFVFSGQRPASNVSYWTGWFRKNEPDAGVEAAVYLSFSSTVCRRVKTGTKLVEQDVYETVCEPIEVPA